MWTYKDIISHNLKEKTLNFRKYTYWNQSLIILVSFIILYPISKFLNQSYNLLIILLALLSFDYFFRNFALNWVRKTNNKISHSYSENYWNKSNWEEFLVPFLQIFITPLIIFFLFHFDITYYSWPSLVAYPILYVISFISFFAFLFTILPIIVFLYSPKNSVNARLERVFLIYVYFLPEY